ncbi:MAG: D-2-hydroxyacid dehydrogenase [Thermoguttaceae bacterium]|nr:D-2-hydroxyacid dehydrogenase [Thermoguttaceae bacterium]
MRIVVLDGFTANPGDLDDSDLRGLVADCRIYERTSPAEIVRRAAHAEILLTNKTMLDAAVLAQLPECRYIGVLATGYNVVDLVAARRHGITVTNIPAYSTDSVAQAVFAHLLEHTHRVAAHTRWAVEHWSNHRDFSYTDGAITELAGLTMGLVGFGAIGHAVARIAAAFGMRLLVSTRTVPSELPTDILPGGLSATEAAKWLRFVDLDTLFRESDVISLHCPLTPSTERLISAERLAMMRRTAILINTGRGGLVDEPALAAALRNGQIAGAGLDVLSSEPPQSDHPLLSAPHCTITPHYAWATAAARRRLLEIATGNVRDFLNGHPQNVVS